MSTQTRISLSVSIDPPVPMVLKGWNGAEFTVRTIRQDFTFRDGGWTPRRIEAMGKKIKKDGTPSTVSAKSDWGQEFTPEVHRRLKAAAESTIRAAVKAAVA